MDFFRRLFQSTRASDAQSMPPAEDSASQYARRAETMVATLDIDAAINAHERWKERFMAYLEGHTTEGLDPAIVRLDNHSALGRWLHGVGGDVLRNLPAYDVLMARHQFFHEQAALVVELAQQSEWDKAVQVLNGGYRHASSQVVLLLKELKRSLSQQL
jgi:hypothetical protein